MYTVSKGPSKFVAKTRMGIPSHLENGSWEIKKSLEVYNDEFTNVVSDSKPVFVQLNNKKLNNLRSHETITPEHEEIVKFVSENWSSVTCKSKEDSSIKNGTSTVYYHANEPNSQLKGNITRQECLSAPDFVPFDLDSWWVVDLTTCIRNLEYIEIQQPLMQFPYNHVKLPITTQRAPL